jgi:hypothetical protein
MFLAKLLKVFAWIPPLVQGAEAIFGSKNGEQKHTSVVGFLLLALQFTESISNKDIVDEKAFKEGLDDIIKGSVKCLNASVWYKKQ